MTMSKSRPAFLIAALGAMTPAIVVADTDVAPGAPRAIADRHGALPASVAIGLAAVALLGLAAMLVTRRIGWRLGALVLIAGCALFEGGAIVDGAQTAIAISR